MEVKGTALKVLIYFLRRRRMVKVGRKGKQKWVVENNGQIIFTYKEAQKKFGLSKRRFRDALDNLIELGFIDLNHHGGGMMGDPTLFIISERWRDYGKDCFISKVRPKDTRGLGFTRKNWEERTGKKRKVTIKSSNENDTCPSNKSVTYETSSSNVPSDKNDTRKTFHKTLILKAMRQYYHVLKCSSENAIFL